MISYVHYQRWFDGAEFRARHARIQDLIGEQAVAVVQGGAPVAGFEVFRQSNDFFWLTGIEVPSALLALDARTRRSILYLPRRDGKLAASEGLEPAAEDREELAALTGCDDVREPAAMAGDLARARVIFTPQAPAEGRMACQDTLRQQRRQIESDPWDAAPSREARFTSLLRERCPGAEIRDLSPLLAGLRSIKSPAEIRVLREAGRLTARAAVEAMKATRPGVREHQLGAVADFVFGLRGAAGGGYRPIIATGGHIWMLHYYRNHAPLQDGELVLFDYAPDLGGYTSDIGRMIPVNGRYSAVQRELYGFITRYHQALLRRLRGGAAPADVLAEAAGEMEPWIGAHPFSKPGYETAARKTMASGNAFTHLVGQAVHDCGRRVAMEEPFRPGLVFALDPQMWVPDERLYIRVEDTVAVTPTGVENLTAEAPHELDAIEALVRQGAGLIEAASSPLDPPSPD